MTTPALYADIFSAALEVLESKGLKYAQDMAIEIARKACIDNQGEIYRAPSLKAIETEERNKRIREKSKTMAVADIAREEGLARQTIYGIIGGKNESK